MKFTIGSNVYTVQICPGPLREDGEEIIAIVHEHVILIAGDVNPADRILGLVDQLRRIHECRYGPLSGAGITTFAIDAWRQLLNQGGEAALQALQPPRRRRRAA